jgi:hypothetical protein
MALPILWSMLAVVYVSSAPQLGRLHHLINMALICVDWRKAQPNLLRTPCIERRQSPDQRAVMRSLLI